MIILIIQTIDINIIPVNTLRNTPIVVILIFSIALVMFMNGQMIFEYDISGEVLSIKNYNWFLMNKKLISPIFEIPKKSLIKFEIEEVFLKKYLIIFFKKESGKIMKTKFDITGCTNKQTRNIHLELVYFLINTNHGKKKLEKLINKTKQEILVDFGFEFNHYPSNEWTYTIKTNRLGIRTTLTFYFQNDKVVKVISKKNYYLVK